MVWYSLGPCIPHMATVNIYFPCQSPTPGLSRNYLYLSAFLYQFQAQDSSPKGRLVRYMLFTVHFDIILIQCIPREKNHSPTTEKNHFDQYTNIKLCIKTKLFPIISLIIQACLNTFSFNNVKAGNRKTC